MSNFRMHSCLLAMAFIVLNASGVAAQEKPAAKPKSEMTDPQDKKDEKKAVRPDRLDLDTTLVTGNRELPKVLYIVPWKKAELGDLPAQPFNTLLDEVLQPVDREVFRREVKYFEAVSSGANQPTVPATPLPAAPASK